MTKSIKRKFDLVTVDNLNPLSKLPQKKQSIDYAFTITLKPAMYKKTFERQLHETAGGLIKIFKDCKISMVAELTQTFNIHYHGIISFDLEVHGNDPVKVFFDRLRPFSKIGKSECKQLIHYETWTTYLNKDVKYNCTHRFNAIIIDDYDILQLRDEYELIDEESEIAGEN